MKKIRVYVGFTDGKPGDDFLDAPRGWGVMGFRRRYEARRFYEDVRAMYLVPVQKKRAALAAPREGGKS